MPLSLPLLELLVIAIAPGIFLLWFFFHKDRYEPEPLRLLFLTFILGATSTVPAILIEMVSSSFISEPKVPILEPLQLFLYLLTSVAIVEELCKLGAALPAYFSKRFNEPMDGIVYCAASALGFATVENIMYVLRLGWLTAIVRAFLSVPGHAFFGATMGYYLGLARFYKGKGFIVYAVLVPVILHTAYNFVSSLGLGIISLFFAGLLVFYMYRRVSRQMKVAEEVSPFKPSISPVPGLYEPPFCPSCGRSVTWIPQYHSWYCYNCARYVVPIMMHGKRYCHHCGNEIPPDAVFCSNCGLRQ
jgi:RsiW-degrading membrane proteinase PrsW (M82 family)